MAETLSTFQPLDYDELFMFDGGGLKDIFIIGGKVICTIGVVAGVAAASSGTGCAGTLLAVACGVVAIAAIWSI